MRILFLILAFGISLSSFAQDTDITPSTLNTEDVNIIFNDASAANKITLLSIQELENVVGGDWTTDPGWAAEYPWLTCTGSSDDWYEDGAGNIWWLPWCVWQ